MPNTAYFREYRTKNKEKVQAHQRAYYLRNKDLVKRRANESRLRLRKKDPHYNRKKNLKREYGITPEEYQRLYDRQAGLCAICRKPERTRENHSGGIRPLAVDHDHQTKKVRGLLCGRCNWALGHFGDDILCLQAAIEYLERANGK